MAKLKETQGRAATRARRLKRLFVLGLALVAMGASAAQAATRPDDRAGPLGVGTPVAAVSSHTQAVWPDDRAGPLGVGAPAVTRDVSDVISRYVANHFTAQDQSDVISRYLVSHYGLGSAAQPQFTNSPTAPRPDNRAGALGVGGDAPGIATPAQVRSVVDWGTVALAAGAGALAAFVVALVGLALVRSRRSATAALQS
jgi:hypothetical protein